MDFMFDLPYARSPHPQLRRRERPPRWRDQDPRVGDDPLQRQHHARLLRRLHLLLHHRARGAHHPEPQEDSVIREIEDMRDKVQGFTGTISDLGGPTANMYRLGCRTPEIEAACRKPSCVYPGICQNLTTDHDPLIKIYRRGRAIKGVKKILIGSGLRYDLALESRPSTSRNWCSTMWAAT
jgi:hypothetical protein